MSLAGEGKKKSTKMLVAEAFMSEGITNALTHVPHR